ncbi:DegT/DnrJ/EryC1/StrS family aminotransferase [Clostridium perfringens]|uniref:DegT/DnrJ/EryC1/StrS family aminotransferase n=1 Tax=Clostridium perfringens TaxID=1502 RepID=UPI001A1F812D|nr:aminotransferase class I/II-fold pyridoxal phosphate-dependent enzyme [Clostridium perfringens]HAT4073148.1 aminotransferase class I/II-fold pyridoxal phosphate-dependent enzyme [Clostridium perfringens]
MGGLEEVFVKEAFDTNWIAPLGANVDGFEKELSEYVGSKTGAALASGTAAIHMALKAVEVKRGDKVFCSSLTFAASCNPIIYEGGIPVFIDSEPESHNMSPVALEKAFKAYEENGEMPKAVIVVNLYGQSADMDKIIKMCKKYNVPIIEDAAESLGATYKGKYSGTFGDYGIYSFNGNKIITTSGGGMLVSNNEEGIAKVRFWSTQARDKARHYEHTELGYNYRMSNIVAGIGRGQLRVLEDRIAKKKEIFETYKEAFKDIEDIEMMPVCEYGEPNYWLTTITLSENSKVKPLDIILALEKENIESRPIWKPMHTQPYYKEYEFYSHNDEEEISVSEDIFNRGVCLPSDTKMSDHDMDRVIGIIKNLFQKEINEIDSKKEVLV